MLFICMIKSSQNAHNATRSIIPDIYWHSSVMRLMTQFVANETLFQLELTTKFQVPFNNKITKILGWPWIKSQIPNKKEYGHRMVSQGESQYIFSSKSWVHIAILFWLSETMALFRKRYLLLCRPYKQNCQRALSFVSNVLLCQRLSQEMETHKDSDEGTKGFLLLFTSSGISLNCAT